MFGGGREFPKMENELYLLYKIDSCNGQPLAESGRSPRPLSGLRDRLRQNGRWSFVFGPVARDLWVWSPMVYKNVATEFQWNECGFEVWVCQIEKFCTTASWREPDLCFMIKKWPAYHCNANSPLFPTSYFCWTWQSIRNLLPSMQNVFHPVAVFPFSWYCTRALSLKCIKVEAFSPIRTPWWWESVAQLAIGGNSWYVTVTALISNVNRKSHKIAKSQNMLRSDYEKTLDGVSNKHRSRIHGICNGYSHPTDNV